MIGPATGGFGAVGGSARWDRLVRVLLLLALLMFAMGIRADVSITAGTMEGARGCVMDYESYKPAEPATESVIILAHGFKRNLSTMRGWAEEWSSLGIPVVIPSLCNSSWFKGRHDSNALDLVALRKELEIESVLYSGFSAGGLAAYLAALDDTATVAYLGLDSVDSGDLARDAERALTVPAFFILGGASACNARQNFMAVINQWDEYQSKEIAGAGHCHFERPFDSKCEWACANGDLTKEEAVQHISELAQTWLLSTLDLAQVAANESKGNNK